MIRHIVLVALGLLLVRHSEGADCSAKEKLKLQFMNSTTSSGNPSTCSDGTAPSIFVDVPKSTVPKPYDWIIYLGDGDTCDEAECNELCDLDVNKEGGVCFGVATDFSGITIRDLEKIDRDVLACYLARVQCGSSDLTRTPEITPETVLCEDDSPFGSFARAFVPMCTLDWWLGRGNTKDPSSTRFRGAFVVDQVIEHLDAQHNLKGANKIVLVGTRGGGIGALHSAKFVREKLNGPEVITIADSAWFVDIEGFAPVSEKPNDVFIMDTKLQKDTKEWIEFGRLNEDCDLVWNVGGPGVSRRHRCLIVPELLPFIRQEKVMFIHSQYDLLFLSQLGLLDRRAAERFIDTTSYALSAIAYVESFGSVMRSTTVESATVEPAVGSDKHFFFSPACGTHGYIFPIRLQSVPETTQGVGAAGSVRLSRNRKSWETIMVGDKSVQQTVGEWIINGGNGPILPSNLTNVSLTTDVGVVTDQCTGFLCNPTCTEEILPFRVSAVFSPCGRNVVLLYAVLMMILLWLLWGWAYANIRLFRHRTALYLSAFQNGKPLPDFGYERARLKALNQKELDDERDAKTITTNTPQLSPSPLVNQQSTTTASPFPPQASYTPLVTNSPLASPPPVSPAVHEEEEEEIDFKALAEALTSKDKATRAAAKKLRKQYEKEAAERRKLRNKTQAEQEYYEKEKKAKKEFEERKAEQTLQAQQTAADAEQDALEKSEKATKNKWWRKNKKNNDAAVEQTDEERDDQEDSPIENIDETNVISMSPLSMSSPTVEGGKIQQKAQDELLIEAAYNDYRQVHLMVRDLSYWANPRKKPSCLTRMFRGNKAEHTKYQILKNIDLAVKPGQLHALMGPSGSGKSTLLDVLALIRDSGEMQGAHYINGARSHHPEAQFLRDWLRNNVSYVKQTDVLFPRMTVREHLIHSAWLMLPQFMPDSKKLRRVQQVIELLELETCSETICGDGGVKIEGGISGGQRRRVSVATQLLRLPTCLLLDEPTSGLDSTNALLLVKSLYTLAHRGGLTVIMTIHQPRNEIFALFDQLTILVAGRIVFSGLPNDAMGHFSIDRGDKQELSVSNTILDKLATSSDHDIDMFVIKYLNGPLGKQMTDDMKAQLTDFTPELADDLQEVLRENAKSEGRWSWETPSSAGMQMWVLMSRTMRRGGFDVMKSGILAALGGCVMGLCFLGINSVTSRIALCYMGVATMTFVQGAFLGDRYLGEKQMYDHESSAGSAVQWTAILANQFARDAVTSTVEAVAFGIPAYWIGGMFPDPERFFRYLFLLILLAHVCISWNVMVEIDRNNLRTAALVNVAYVGLGALFNGFIIRIRDLPVYLTWLPYVMVTYWAFAGVLVNDFTGDTFGCEASILECATRTGDVVIVTFSFSEIDPFVSMLAMCIMAIVFRSFAVLDFFLRYVRGRGSGLKLKKGGASLEEDHENTNRSLFGSTKEKLGSVMSHMVSGKGNHGKKMIEQQKRENQLNTERVIARGGGVGIAFNEEWDQVQEYKGANKFSIAAKEPLYRRVFQSRFLLVVICTIDVGLLGMVCALAPGVVTTYYAFVTINTLVALFFAIQFIVSICFLIPITPNGPRDCTWAGTNDFVAFLATIGDIVLLIQLWTSTAFQISTDGLPVNPAGSATFLILAGFCRITRIVRVCNFWFKVGRFHEVSALSWLIAAENEKQAKIATTISGDSVHADTRPKSKSMRLAASNPMWASHASAGRLSNPPRPAFDPDMF